MNVSWEKLKAFAKESNEIENIFDEDRHQRHAEMLAEFIRLDAVTVPHLEVFVAAIQPGAKLRKKGERVRVGDWIPPDGDVSQRQLKELLKNMHRLHPWRVHQEYETIHPFIDGNGRSGRAIWLWQMVRQGWTLDITFLRMFYYQTLSHWPNREAETFAYRLFKPA